MAVDYSKIPTSDLENLKAGHLARVSTKTLEYLRREAGGGAASKPPAPPTVRSAAGKAFDTAVTDRLSKFMEHPVTETLSGITSAVGNTLAEPFRLAGEAVAAPLSAIKGYAKGAGAFAGTLAGGGSLKQALREGKDQYMNQTVESPLGQSQIGKVIGNIVAPDVNRLGKATGHPGAVNALAKLAGDTMAVGSVAPIAEGLWGATRSSLNKLRTEGAPFTDKNARFQAAQKFNAESQPIGTLDAPVQAANVADATALENRITSHLPTDQRPSFTPGQRGGVRHADREATRRSTTSDPTFARRLDLNDAALAQAARENVTNTIPGTAGEGGRTVRTKIDEFFRKLQGGAQVADQVAAERTAPYAAPDSPQTQGGKITDALTEGRKPLKAAKAAAYKEVDELGYDMDFPSYKKKVGEILDAAGEESEPVATAVRDILSKTIDKAKSTSGYDAVYKTLNGYLRDLKGSSTLGASRIASLLQDAKSALISDAEAMSEAAAKGDVAIDANTNRIVRPSVVRDEIAALEKRIAAEEAKAAGPDVDSMRTELMKSGDSSAMKQVGEKPDQYAARLTKQYQRAFPDKQPPTIAAADARVVDEARAAITAKQDQLTNLQPAEDFAAKYKAATNLARLEADRYGRGAVDEVFRQGNQAGGARLAAEKLPSRFATETGADDLARALSDSTERDATGKLVITDAGRKAAGDLMRDYYASEASTRLADPRKLTAWVESAKVKPVLKKLGLYDEFSNLKRIKQTLAESQSAVEQFEKSTVGKIMGRDPDDIVKYVMAQPDPAATVREIKAFGKGDKAYVNGLKVAVRDWVLQSSEVTAEDILGATKSSMGKAKKLQVSRVEHMLKEVFNPTEQQALADFHATIRNLSRNKTTPHGNNSATAYLLHAKDRVAYGVSRDLAKHAAGGVVNGFANMVSALVKILGKAHLEKIEQIVDQAHLNPADAKMLTDIYKATRTKSGMPTPAQLGQIQARIRGWKEIRSETAKASGGVVGNTMQSWGKEEDDAEPRQDGGPVAPGQKYLVGEKQPETLLNADGTKQIIGTGGPQVITAQQPGMVTPMAPQSDYDYAGYAAKYGQPDQSKGQHLTDEFKLPNHITFSQESKYSKKGQEGGKWVKEKDGSWTFYASEYNLKNHTPEELMEYFARHERGNRLVLPGAQQ